MRVSPGSRIDGSRWWEGGAQAPVVEAARVAASLQNGRLCSALKLANAPLTLAARRRVMVCEAWRKGAME